MKKRWKLCKGKNGCSRPSADDEFHHAGLWKIRKKAA
jgi:hypothetical protein